MVNSSFVDPFLQFRTERESDFIEKILTSFEMIPPRNVRLNLLKKPLCRSWLACISVGRQMLLSFGTFCGVGQPAAQLHVCTSRSWPLAFRRALSPSLTTPAVRCCHSSGLPLLIPTCKLANEIKSFWMLTDYM